MTEIPIFILRSSIVLLAGLTAARLMRKQPAALRHSIIAAALVLAATQPLIARFIPALTVPPIDWTVEAIPAEPAVAVETEFVPTPSIAAPPPAKALVDWSRVLFMTWLAGVAVSLVSLMVGMAWLVWLQSQSRPASPDWLEVESSVRSQLGGGRPVPILMTPHPALIATWGVIAPAVLLPIEADRWSTERKRMVIAHEVAHWLRRDWLIQVLAEVARSINWFNPLFWIACATLRRESEHACDDLVLETGIAGTAYASDLLALARTLRVHGRTWLPAPSIARPSTLERRVRAMLNPQLNRRPVSRPWRYALIALLSAMALPIAAASQSQNAPAGRVADPMGRPLADADLRLTDINSGQVYESKSDGTGTFQFPQVPAGPYLLSVRYPGFASSRHRLDLNGGGTTITLQVQVGTLKETITVLGGNDDPRIGTATLPRSVAAAAGPAPTCGPSAAGQLTPPMKIRDVRPVYRRELVETGVAGEILLQAKIGKDGKVRSVDVVSPVNADLEDAAIAAVTQWQFSPTYLNCEPVEVQMFVTVVFKLP